MSKRKVSRMTQAQCIDRFWSRVDKSGDCWLWLGAIKKTRKGYGVTHDSTRKFLLVHRFSYELANGAIPSGMCVCHHCDNPPCVRPDHLFIGTHADNVADRSRKGRTRWKALFGSQHPRAKLREADIPVIRSLVKSGMSWSSVAARFGVSKATVGDIVARVIWRRVPEEACGV